MSEGNNNMLMQLNDMGEEDLIKLLENKKADLNNFMNDIIHQAAEVGGKFDVMYDSLCKTQVFVKKLYFSYLTYCKQKSKKPVLSMALKDISVSDYEIPNDLSYKYFKEIYKLDTEVRESFICSSDMTCLFHIKLAANMYNIVEPQLNAMRDELEKNLMLVTNSQGENLFSILMELMKESAAQPKEMRVIMEQIKKLLEFAEDIAKKIKIENIEINENSESCRSMYDSFVLFLDGTKSTDEKLQETMSPSMKYGFNEPVDMLQKIFDFIEIDDEEKNEFLESYNTFKEMPDKKSSDDDARRLRKTLTTQYYNLYEKVFIKAEEENVEGVVLDLFFNFGIVDETLFKSETIEKLKTLSQTGEIINAKVYTMKDWLHAIYTGEKAPSKNDLDMDYFEYVNDMSRRGDINEEQKQQYLTDSKLKVNFEIQNFVQMNSRLTNGELSVFCPVVTQDSFIGDVEAMYITDKKISETIEWLLRADFSLFHREQMYDDRENGIINMVINKQVFPDVILMPVAGIHSRMWQEIDGKKRDTPGRFTLPAFTKQDLKDMLVKAAGSFRWQLCKKIQGNYWNVISEKSLTSEYYDYIQFYKKNRDLTDQSKEKITSQLQRARNNFSECFIMDYVLWIKNEVSGSVRLNKIVRDIMATYCTPVKEVREGLKQQPMFKEAFSRFERERTKKSKEINNRRAAIRNSNGTETPEFIEEAKFIQEM